MRDLESVMVTGGGGFIGSHTASYYRERDVDVTVFDNLSRSETLNQEENSQDTNSYNWRYLRENYPDINFVRGDIRDAELVADVVEGHDGIIHTAGQVAVTASLNSPRVDFDVNAKGTFNVLEGARQADSNPAVVFASTNKVYGDNVNNIPVKEEDRRYTFSDPDYSEGIPESLSIDESEHTPYGVSKLSADLYVQDYAYRNEVEAAAFRMSCIYGPRQFGIEDQGWIAHFILSTLQNKPLTIFGDGKQVRDALYVTDLVRAYDSFLRNPANEPAVYNIGGGPERTTSLLELLDLLERKTGMRPDIEFKDWREGDQKVYISNIKRAKDALNWQPEVSLEEGIDRFIQWYKAE